MTPAPAARELTAWAEALRPTEDDLALARRSLLDTAAVAVAALEDPLVRLAAPALGTGGRLAVAAHVLDYDDLHLPSTSHVSAVCVPAAVAAGGDARAYLAGAGVMARLGARLGWAHYQAGWHATCTAGAPAAAVAAGVAAGLDADGLARAMALAIPAAGGNHRAFGTQAKSLQVGFAIDAGLRAASLAAAGATADPAAMDAWIELLGGAAIAEPRVGAAAADVAPDTVGAAAGRASAGAGRGARATTAGRASAGPDRGPAAPGVGPGAGATAAPVAGAAIPGGLAVKLHPCCYALQRPIAAVREAVDGHGSIAADEVESILVTAPGGTLRPLIHDRPTTGLEGKFSLQYAVAATLLDGAPDLTSFTDAAVARPDAQSLMARVEVRRTPGEGDLLAGEVGVEVKLRGGESLAATVDLPPGAPGRPPTEAELGEKVAACAGRDGAGVAALNWDTAATALAALLSASEVA
jgi:2-methylcitrate dehydratase PrpD